MELLSLAQRNGVLEEMIQLLDTNRAQLISANKKDLDAFDPNDRAMYDRLIINDYKIDGMITCLLYTSPSPRDLSTSRMPSSA